MNGSCCVSLPCPAGGAAQEANTENGKGLTCELDPGLPADHGAQGVAGDALVHAAVVDGVRIADEQVSLHQTVVGLRLGVDLLTVHLPPAGGTGPGDTSGQEVRVCQR